MVSSGSSEFHSEESIEFSSELRYKLRTLIRYNLPWQTTMFPDMLEEELSSPGHREGHDSWNEVSSFSDGVDNDHDRVIPFTFILQV